MAAADTAPVLGTHGASRLPSVTVDSYNAEIKDDEGFVGDKASRSAFYEILDKWRKPLRKLGTDPFGDTDTDEISKKKLDELLATGDHEAAGVIQSAIEEFAQTLAKVTKRFLKLKAWDKTERIVIGGGFREARIGELAIGRADILLKAEVGKIDLVPIRFHPDEAGLIGCVHLAPAWIFKAHDSILAVDIGGTNIRVGVVEPNVKKDPHLSKARVWKSKLWRHADESPSREETVKELVAMLDELAKRAIKDGHALAPFVGIACPGAIEDDGDIAKGAQNLPGNWESSHFNLPQRICESLTKWDDHDTVVLMHNDAVVQGLSEVPFMQDVKRWGVLTIGTGLGNARFTNHTTKKD
jgi:predicted NBD/HSP70 family sugar kinase